jgi:tetratricopeptide (TPR) repeat protein
LDHGALDGLCPRCLALHSFSPDDDSASAAPMDHPEPAFGDYELLEPIARGGMGVVYKARQVSLDRIVALKLISDGVLAGDAAIARFRTEAAAAAGLHHPNLVAIHEIGEHAGRLYFSMEYVAGPTLAALVKDGPLPARRAAEYVRAAAMGVQAAHDQGVLHRDLKPSNILVDERDQPRVADFGVAKRLDGASDLTLTGQILGTPAYMAPEQARGGGASVGPAADVYSLGAVLYHLLTGRPPFTAETMTDVLRQVAEREPVAPRLLNPALPRDLETICLKCLAKEAARRYATARELAEDLGRFLQGLPIHARPIGEAERLWRWCRRNPVVASLTTATAALLLAVAVGSTLAARRIEASRKAEAAEHQQAVASQARAERINRFLKEMLESPDPTKEGHDVRVVDVLAKAAERARVDFAAQPDVLAEVLQTVGTTYYSLAEYDPAEPLLRQALELYARTPGKGSRPYARCQADLGNLLHWSGRYAEAITNLHEAVAALRLHQPGSERELADALYSLGTAMSQHGHDADADPPLQEAMTLASKVLGETNIIGASALNQLAMNRGTAGDLDGEQRFYRESLRLMRQLPNTEMDQATIQANLGQSFMLVGRLDEAAQLLAESLALRRRLYGEETSPVAIALFKLAGAHLRQGRLVEAEKEVRSAIQIQRKTLPEGHRDFTGSLSVLGQVLTRSGNLAEGERTLREAQAIAGRIYPAEHWIGASLRSQLGECLVAQGRFPEAEPLLLGSVAALERQFGPKYPYTVEARKRVGSLYEKWGKPELARRFEPDSR